MRTEDFDYALPPDRIAQRPVHPRDHARLLILDRAADKLRHARFDDLPALLRPGDALVVNETRVLPARLRARKAATGGGVELLLVRRLADQTWEALVGGKGVVPGVRLEVLQGPTATVEVDLGGSRRQIHFDAPIVPELDRLGTMPVPPYIKAPLQDPEEYQTVFARTPGSAAAPTAGLHFTPSLLETLRSAGVLIVQVTLHIGLDTFAPVEADDPRQHVIHTEWCQLTDEAARALTQARRTGGRIVAVGTTSVRALETAARQHGGLEAFEGPTDLFILPGFRFQAVDAIITNFHLPRSTLLMMVSAFGGRERLLHAYQVAIQEGYRFYSFGDAMLIV